MAIRPNPGRLSELLSLQSVPNTVLFHTIPQNLSPLRHLLSSNRPYVVRGLVEESFGIATLTVFDLQPLESTWGAKANQPTMSTPVGDCAHEL